MKVSIKYLLLLTAIAVLGLASQVIKQRTQINLPSSKLLSEPVPGAPQRVNSFPAALALSPDHRFLAILNEGFGTYESEFRQSIAILDLTNNTVSNYPDSRLAQHARQSYFLGLAFSQDGSRLYASLGSLTDPEGKSSDDTGNAIGVYSFSKGYILPEKVVPIALQALAHGKYQNSVEDSDNPLHVAIPYPAGITTVNSSRGELLLVADNLSDDALLIQADTGKVVQRFDLSRHSLVPSEFPYTAITTRDGKIGYVSLWNASQIAKLDLISGRVLGYISLSKPSTATAAGSHPTAMLLGPDERKLYVALANTDQVAVVDAAHDRVEQYLSVKLPGQQYGGNYPIALAQNEDGTRLFVANASSDAIAVFDVSKLGERKGDRALGFIPTEWYPTALAVHDGELFIATGKGHGAGPNNMPAPENWSGRDKRYTYIPTLLHGSIARVSLRDLDLHLSEWTAQVMEDNGMRGNADHIQFAAGGNPIRHVIYIIKENRSYDQILGDLGAGDGDPSLTMYGEEITPNEHKLARQFGLLDNFYTSGEVSGNGHVWSTAAITSDYTEQTWQIVYRGDERSYDFDGSVGPGDSRPLEHDIPDVNEPGTGYLWSNFARHKISYRHYGEFINSEWCNPPGQTQSSQPGAPLPPAEHCAQSAIRKGDPLPPYLGQPHGGPSPWPWEVPLLERNIATKPELRGHFDPRFPDFNLKFPDQLRADEFLNEFAGFVQARQSGHGESLPQFILLRLPNDHTSGASEGSPTPSASLADNDLAVGRVVEAVSHSPYWDDTAIFILEDDAQSGPDHVEAHRSVAWVVSKYSPAPGDSAHPFVDHAFYTTVNMVHTMESLLGAPPMNNNDARAALMVPMFSGSGRQPVFTADTRNRDNGLIYRMNTAKSAAAKESARMDFSRADAANAADLNRILWSDRMGARPFPDGRKAMGQERSK